MPIEQALADLKERMWCAELCYQIEYRSHPFIHLEQRGKWEEQREQALPWLRHYRD